MKKYIIFCFAWLIAVVLLGACSGPKKETMNQNKKDAELTISAAASMKDAMEEIQKLYEKEHPHVKLFLILGLRAHCSSKFLKAHRLIYFYLRLKINLMH